jgi:hypothetical protein
MHEYRSPMRVEDATFTCNHCDQPIAPTSENWKDGATSRSWPLSERAAQLGTKVRPTAHVPMVLWEHYCGACGTLLEAEICQEGQAPAHDVRLGAVRDEPGEPF